MTTKSLLKNWDTFSREKLAAAYQAELDRSRGGMTKLSLEEQQLLDAAHSRLLTWRSPSRTSERGKIMRTDDDPVATPADDPAAQAAGKEPEPKKARRAASSKKKGSTAKEATVAKKAKATKKTAKAKRVGNGAERIPADAKILAVKGAKNPFREGSGAYERTETVVKATGKTRESIEKLKGIMSTTIPNLVKAGVVRVG